MCSRECYSVSLGGLIAGLLVFLAAFLLGIGAVRSVVTIFLPDAEITGLRRSVGPIVVQRHTPREDVEPLEVIYAGMTSHMVNHFAVEERFQLTNFVSKPIFFESKDNESLTVHILSSGGFFNSDVPFKVPVRRLEPGDSAYGSGWIPVDATGYKLSISYSVGDRHVHRTASFEDPF